MVKIPIKILEFLSTGWPSFEDASGANFGAVFGGSGSVERECDTAKKSRGITSTSEQFLSSRVRPARRTLWRTVAKIAPSNIYFSSERPRALSSRFDVTRLCNLSMSIFSRVFVVLVP